MIWMEMHTYVRTYVESACVSEMLVESIYMCAEMLSMCVGDLCVKVLLAYLGHTSWDKSLAFRARDRRLANLQGQ